MTTFVLILYPLVEYESGSWGYRKRGNGTHCHVAYLHRGDNEKECLHSLQNITLSSQLVVAFTIHTPSSAVATTHRGALLAQAKAVPPRVGPCSVAVGATGWLVAFPVSILSLPLSTTDRLG